MSFFRFLARFGRAREHKALSDWLVRQAWFRNAAIKLHHGKKGLFKDVEEYLDEELLGKKPRERLDVKANQW